MQNRTYVNTFVLEIEIKYTWMMYQSQLAIGRFDFIRSRGALEAENLVRFDGWRTIFCQILDVDVLVFGFARHFAVIEAVRMHEMLVVDSGQRGDALENS